MIGKTYVGDAIAKNTCHKVNSPRYWWNLVGASEPGDDFCVKVDVFLDWARQRLDLFPAPSFRRAKAYR